MQKNHTLPYILPLLTVIALALVFTRPGLTGFITAPAAEVEVKAQIRVATSAGQVLPVGSEVAVYLTGAGMKRNASMPIEEFMRLSGEAIGKAEGNLSSIGYSGPGYTGSRYIVNLSFFDIDRTLLHGRYMLRTEVSYKGDEISTAKEFLAVS